MTSRILGRDGGAYTMGMIAFIGDVHRSFDLLEQTVARLPWAIQTVIQLGDLGLTATDVKRVARGGSPPATLDRPVYWIDGNWDDFGGLSLRDITEPSELVPNLIYVPRGYVLELDGRRLGFLGGAESIDGERSRSRGVDWWPELEHVSEGDVTRLLHHAGRTKGVDLLVAHVPPAAACEAMTGLPSSLSAVRVQQAQSALGRVPVIAGHMHRAWRDDQLQVTVVEEMGLAFK
jgi:predicted phosphodiesterase